MKKIFIIVESLLSEFISKKSESLKHTKAVWASINGIYLLILTQKLNVAGTASVEILTDSLIKNYLRGLEK